MALTATSGRIIWKMLQSAAPYSCDDIFDVFICYLLCSDISCLKSLFNSDMFWHSLKYFYNLLNFMNKLGKALGSFSYFMPMDEFGALDQFAIDRYDQSFSFVTGFDMKLEIFNCVLCYHNVRIMLYFILQVVWTRISKGEIWLSSLHYEKTKLNWKFHTCKFRDKLCLRELSA